VAKRRKSSDAGVPEWVVTYGDLMSLLLCFFILLAAFSELKQPREYRKAMEYIQQALGFEGGLGVAKIREMVQNSTTKKRPERAQLDGQAKHTDESVISNVTGPDPRTTVVHQSERTAVGGAVPFEVGETALSPIAKGVLRDEVAPRIKGQRFVFIVTGHAFGRDDVKIAGLLDEDDLAFRRAKAAKDFLVRECGVDPSILRVESAGAREPATVGGGGMNGWSGNRRVQVYQTGRTVDQTHPDALFTGAER
jgi:chemotaxis protein MotB